MMTTHTQCPKMKIFDCMWEEKLGVQRRRMWWRSFQCWTSSLSHTVKDGIRSQAITSKGEAWVQKNFIWDLSDWENFDGFCSWQECQWSYKRKGCNSYIFIKYAYLGRAMREMKMIWDLIRMRVKMFGLEEQSKCTRLKNMRQKNCDIQTRTTIKISQNRHQQMWYQWNQKLPDRGCVGFLYSGAMELTNNANVFLWLWLGCLWQYL
jgi:hypothetical protein